MHLIPDDFQLRTPRLRIRGFVVGDALDVQRVFSAPSITQTTVRLPVPLDADAAGDWIRDQQTAARRGEALVCAVVLDVSNELIGAVGLHIRRDWQRAELSYWIGEEWWSRGYATEAARAMTAYGFDRLDLNRVYAGHFGTNAGSGRVLEKLGMRQEGRLREHVVKEGGAEDVVYWGLLRSEYDAVRSSSDASGS